MSLQLFDVPDVDYRYEASREVEFQPALTGIQPITFSIPGAPTIITIPIPSDSKSRSV